MAYQDACRALAGWNRVARMEQQHAYVAVRTRANLPHLVDDPSVPSSDRGRC